MVFYFLSACRSLALLHVVSLASAAYSDVSFSIVLCRFYTVSGSRKLSVISLSLNACIAPW